MGFESFWLQFNNGKKEQLGDTKSGIRKEQVDKKFHNLFDAYDTNQSEVLESNELEGIFKTLSVYAGNDKVLDNTENQLITSLFGANTNVKDIDFQGFVRSVSNASADIIESKETQLEDGGKEIFTTYKDGTKETVGYYPNGEFKYKKTEKILSETHYYVEINGQKQEVDKQNYELALKRMEEMQAQQNKPRMTDSYQFNLPSLMPDVIITSQTEERPDIQYDFSGRANLDIQARDFLLTHFIETHYGTQDALDTMGFLDDIGAVINAGAGELWNACVNIYNKHFGNGTEEDYKNFYELVKKFEPQYDKAILMKPQAEAMQRSPELYFRNFETDFENRTGNKYNLQEVMQFQQLAEQYQVASVLSMRMDCLKKALNEVRMYQSTQDALTYNSVQSEGMNPAQHLLNAQEYLLQYFDNDKEAADLILNGTIGNADKTMEAINSLLSDTELQLKDALNKKEIALTEDNGDLKVNADSIGSYNNFEELKEVYQNSYKAMYGTDFVPDELTDKVMSAKATGGFVKIAAITIVSILITKSPVMTNIMRASAGAVVDGASANFIRGLVSKYGQTVVQQGIKFAMSTGTLATDVGLTLLNQVTDNREGINGEEVWETTKGAAKYIYFGAFVGSPIAQAVTQKVGKLGIASKLFVNGTKTTQGAITTTSITGEQLVQNFMKASQSMVAKGAGFATDIAAFTLLDITTEDIAPGEALTSQAEMLTGLRIMHKAFEYMLGGRTHTAIQKANWEAAIEKSGVKNWNIKEVKTPTADGKGFKVVYDVDFNGIPLGKMNDANALITAMMGKVSETYHAMETERNTKPKTETSKNEEVIIQEICDKYKDLSDKELQAEIIRETALGNDEKVSELTIAFTQRGHKVSFADSEGKVVIEKVDNKVVTQYVEDLVNIRFEKSKNLLLAELKKNILLEDYFDSIERNLTADNIEKVNEVYNTFKNEIGLPPAQLANILKSSTVEEMTFILDLYSKIKENPEYAGNISNLYFIAKEYKSPEDYIESLKQEKLARENELIAKSNRIQDYKLRIENLAKEFKIPQEELASLKEIASNEYRIEEYSEVLIKYLEGVKTHNTKVNYELIKDILESDISFNKDGRESLIKLLENSYFYEYPEAGHFLQKNSQIVNSATPLFSIDPAINRIEIVTHILNSENLRNNKTIMRILAESPNLLLNYADTPEIATLRKNLLDKVATKDEASIQLALSCFVGIKDDAGLNFVDKILSNENFSQNQEFVSFIKERFNYRQLEENSIKRLTELLDLLEQDKALLETDMIKQKLSYVASFVLTDGYRENVLKILKDKNLYNNPIIQENFDRMLLTFDYNRVQEVSEAKAIILEFLANNPSLLKNEKITEYLVNRTQYIDEKEVADAQIYFIQKILETGLDKSNKLDLLLSNEIRSKKDAETKFRVFELIEKQYNGLKDNIKAIIDEDFSRILLMCHEESSLRILETVFSEKHLLENECFMGNCLVSVLFAISSKEGLTENGYINFLKNKELCSNENFEALRKIQRTKATPELDSFIIEMFANKELNRNTLVDIANSTTDTNLAEIYKMYKSEVVPNECIKPIIEKVNFYRDYSTDSMVDYYKIKLDFIEKYLYNKEFPKEDIPQIAEKLYQENAEFILSLCESKTFPKKAIVGIAEATHGDGLTAQETRLAKIETAQVLVDIGFPPEGIPSVVLSEVLNFNKSKLNDQTYLEGLKELSIRPNVEKADIQLYDAFSSFVGKNELSELTKTEKKEFLLALLSQKTNFTESEVVGSGLNLKRVAVERKYVVSELFPIIPKGEKGYSEAVKELTEALNISVTRESDNVINRFNSTIDNLYKKLISNEEVSLEQLKIDMPMEFKPQITQENIELLSKVIKHPKFETFSDIDKRIVTVATLLNNVDKTSGTTSESAFDAFFIMRKFGLSEKEARKVYTIIETSDLIDKFMNTTKKETIVDGFRLGQVLIGNERANVFDILAFKLKEGNNLDLAQVLYSAKEKEGLTRYLDKALEDRIFEIKSSDFFLPQTSETTYQEMAVMTPVYRDGKQYNVPVVYASQIESFFAYIHTPEAGFATRGGRETNIATLEVFKGLMDDKVVCADFISKDKVNTCANDGFIVFANNESQYVAHCDDMYSLGKNIPEMMIEYYRDRGFESAKHVSRHEYRTFVSDGMKSLMYPEYAELRNRQKAQASDIASKYRRQINLYEEKLETYLSQLKTTTIEADKIELTKKIEKVEIEIRKLKSQRDVAIHDVYKRGSNSELDRINANYIARVDRAKEFLGDEIFSDIPKLREIDPELANMYEQYLQLDNLSKPIQGVLKSDHMHHNEALLGEIKIGPAYTTDLYNMPIEYLELSEQTGKPIVVLDIK